MNALKDEEFYTYLKEHLEKVVEPGKELSRFINIVNKIDDLLDKNIQEYRKLICDIEHSLSINQNEIQKIQKNLEIMLKALQSILCTKAHISRFKSIERLIQIIPLSMDFNIIRKCLDIIFVKFTLEDIPEGDYQYFEKDIPKLCYQISYLFQHHNLSSFYSLTLQDLFKDDSKYNDYLAAEGLKNDHCYEYKDDLIFELLNRKSVTKITNESSVDSEPISINIADINDKYPDETHYIICKKIVKAYNLNVDENSPLFDKILFKIRACKSFSNFNHRCLLASTSIDSLRLLSNITIYKIL